MALPLFPVTTVGSWPRTPELLAAQRALRHGRASREEFDRVADAAVRAFVALQESVGVDIVTDGELRRDNFYSFVADRCEGVRMLTLAEMLDVVEDKAGFEQLLQTLDVPAYAISNPCCTGLLRRREPLAVRELEFVRRMTDRPVKVTLPGPYLLTRAMFVRELTREVYATKEDLARDVVALLRSEIAELAAAGAAFVQLDEPVLTELVFAEGKTRTFMCAALAARNDPREELEFAVRLVNEVLEGFEPHRTAVHVCRGNWSRDERTLLRGSYAPLAPYLTRMHARQLVLEYATDRAGSLVAFDGKELGLGVVNPRSERVESVGEVREAIARALQLYPPERLFLNPDCGFGTFATRPMNSGAVAEAKLRVMVEAARQARN